MQLEPHKSFTKASGNETETTIEFTNKMAPISLEEFPPNVLQELHINGVSPTSIHYNGKVYNATNINDLCGNTIKIGEKLLIVVPIPYVKKTEYTISILNQSITFVL